MTKEEYFQDLAEVITDKIYLTESLSELDKEIRENMWALNIDSDMAEKVTVSDYSQFIDDVKLNRQLQLQQSNLNLDKLLFYLWHDEQAGQLRFNIIHAHHMKLPFHVVLETVDSQDEIIKAFLAPLDSIAVSHTLKIYTEEIIA